ncbi:MAG: DHCW motif cupin fold protein [Terriglobales bacterium]
MTARIPGKRGVAVILPVWGSGYTPLMKMSGFSFVTTDWTQVAPSEHPGENGVALWRTQTFGEIRVRMVEYSPGYSADHWCSKGHVILCLEGELETVLADGRHFTLKAGDSYQTADGEPGHRSSTRTGARLFIVD